MLIMLYGTSCSGKSTIIRILNNKYQVIPVNCYMTRLKREDDFARTQINVEEFNRLEKAGEFEIVNKHLSSNYGNKRSELQLAIADTQNLYVLDFLIKDYLKLEHYSYFKVIIIPESEAQLIDQIHQCGREIRKEEILKDFHENYNSQSLADFEGLGFHIIKNIKDHPEQTALEILNKINTN